MYGTPWEEKLTLKMTEEEIWRYLSDHLRARNIVTAGSWGGSDTQTDYWGIVQGHAYSVSDLKKL